MGIFGRAPSVGGPGPSRRDRRQSGARSRSKTGARRETERRAQVFVVAGIIVTAVVVLGIGGFGYYQTSIAPKHQTVLKVGGRSFSMGYVEERLRYEIHNADAGTLAQTSAQLAVYQTVTALESEEVNRIGAANENISVSEDEIDARIRQELGVADSADQATYAEAYRNAVHDSGLSPDQYREVIASKVLEDKIRQNLSSAIPTTAEQVRIRDVQVATQEEAQKVVDRLAAGEDFAALVTELSLDSTTKDKGGEMGWKPKAALETAAGDAVFALEVGRWTQPVSSSRTGSYFVYQVEEKSPSMEVTADQQSTIEEQSYTNWQDATSSQIQFTRSYITDTKIWNHLLVIATKEGTSTGQ
jgi:parvulin-like peptidyl-prolyl isomerase